MTEERRRDMIKVARHKGEEAKVAIRNVRRKAKEELDRIVKDGEAGEDDGRRAEKELDDLTHRYVAQHRRAGQAQGSRAARGLMSYLDEPDPTTRRGARPASATGGRPSVRAPADLAARPACGRRRRPYGTRAIGTGADAPPEPYWPDPTRHRTPTAPGGRDPPVP